MIGLVLVIIIVGLLLYHYSIHYSKVGKVVNRVPGPTTLPLLGNALEFMGSLEQMFTALRKNNTKFYPINRLWLGSMPTISVFHPDDVQIVLSSPRHIEKSFAYNFMQPWFGTGLLTSTGEKWQMRRKLLTPAFHFNILREFADIFVEQSELLVRNLKSEGNEVIKDIVPLVTKFTLDSICETAMGTELKNDGSEDSYRNGVLEMGDYIIYRLIRPWLHVDWLFNLTPTGSKQKTALKNLHALTNKIVAERRKYHEQNLMKDKNWEPTKDSLDDKAMGIRKKRMAMLDILITASRNDGSIDDAGIREEVDTFVFEGHDTTAMGVSFAISLIAEHKEIQERARREVCEVMKDSGGKFGISEVNKLPYLERCIKESLRLFPSVPGIARRINEDLQLKNYIAPAGSNIHVYIYDLQRDPNFWPNPLKFDPDRFLPENSVNRHPFSYVPFSGGPRNCIGQKFAMLELKVLVAQLLYNFNLEAIDLVHDVALFQDLVIRPVKPLRVKFSKRVDESLIKI